MKLSIAIFFALSCFAAGCSPTTNVAVGGTNMCIPKQYSPGFDLTTLMMTRSGRDLPDADEVAIRIEAREIKNAIPSYVVSHSNKYTSAVMHDLDGLVIGPSVPRADLAQDAWVVRTSGIPFYSEQDKRTGYVRIYTDADRPYFMWHLVRSLPPRSPDGPPPKDWYIGHCLEGVSSHDCEQLVQVGNVRMDFAINESNLMMRSEINRYAQKQLRSWIGRCNG